MFGNRTLILKRKGNATFRVPAAGGAWVVDTTLGNISLERIVFPAPTLGWIAADNGRIYRTTDGGAILIQGSGSKAPPGPYLFPRDSGPMDTNLLVHETTEGTGDRTQEKISRVLLELNASTMDEVGPFPTLSGVQSLHAVV